MNAMVQMPDHGELKSRTLQTQEYVFRDTPKRQKQGKIHYTVMLSQTTQMHGMIVLE